MGGCIILRSSFSSVAGISLWESSIKWDPEHQTNSGFRLEPRIGAIIVNWGTEFLLNKQYTKDIAKYSDYTKILPKVRVPLQIVCAEAGGVKAHWRTALRTVPSNNELIIVSGASHCFEEEGTEETLYQNTMRWFKSR